MRLRHLRHGKSAIASDVFAIRHARHVAFFQGTCLGLRQRLADDSHETKILSSSVMSIPGHFGPRRKIEFCSAAVETSSVLRPHDLSPDKRNDLRSKALRQLTFPRCSYDCRHFHIRIPGMLFSLSRRTKLFIYTN